MTVIYRASFYVLSAVLSCVLFGACCSVKETPGTKWHKVLIYEKGWDATSPVAMRPDWIVKSYPDAIEITDHGFISSISERLANIEQLPTCWGGYVNARIVCLLFSRTDRIDTLSFGTWNMALNDGCYQVDTVLLKTIAQRVSSSSQEGIRRMLDRRPEALGQ
jgi:hypothetical protein